MPKRLLRCQSAAVRYLDFEQISLIHSPFRRAFTIISMNFILAFNTEAKLKTRQLPSKVVHRTRTFPKRKNAVERTDERAAIFVLNARFRLFINLVPRASFPLTSGRKTRALGATISGMRHRCRCAVSRITRIRLFPLFFHNGCSQSSRFPTAGQGERSSGNEIDCSSTNRTHAQLLFSSVG